MLLPESVNHTTRLYVPGGRSLLFEVTTWTRKNCIPNTRHSQSSCHTTVITTGLQL